MRTLNDYFLTAKIADISTASSTYVGIPDSGRVIKIITALQGVIATANAAITFEIGGTAMTDSAITVAVGALDDETQRLLTATRESLERAIEKTVPNGRLSDISHAVQSWAEPKGFSVVREFVGHGIGRSLHEAPQIPNYGQAGQGPRLKVGMTLAIEPMINAGVPGVKILDDGWTAVTQDGKRSAHFEHTVAITDNGPEILTQI